MFSHKQAVHAAPSPLWRWTKQLTSGLHHTFAMVGTIALASLMIWISAPDLRLMGMQRWAHWFQSQKLTLLGMPNQLALPNMFAKDGQAFEGDQEAVTDWLSRKYKISPKVLAPLVSTTYTQALDLGLDPTLVLAVIAVESRFNPYAKNPAGAQGLMQISMDNDEQIYELFGGKAAALDPSTNIRIGTHLLKTNIEQAHGSVMDALKTYSSTSQGQLDQYAEKVLMEQSRLQWVTQGKRVPFAYWPQGLDVGQWPSAPWSADERWKKL
jgi:soluble lytic murein transglycosylase-like protein